MTKPVVSIIMGSDSDLPIMQDAAKVLEEFNIPFELTIVSAHRTPHRMYEFAKQAKKKGIQVIIAAAANAAHLPGMMASLTPLPVIGVPIKGKHLEGLDSIMSILQMPAGIPVATVAINGAKNAGLLAAKIIATQNPEVMEMMKTFMADLDKTITKKATQLEKDGYKKYLNNMKQS